MTFVPESARHFLRVVVGRREKERDHLSFV